MSKIGALNITRNKGEVITINDNIKIHVLDVVDGQVTLRFIADEKIIIWRDEIYQKIKKGIPYEGRQPRNVVDRRLNELTEVKKKRPFIKYLNNKRNEMTNEVNFNC